MQKYSLTKVNKFPGGYGQIMVGISENAVYFSSRFRKDMGLVVGSCFSFSYDKSGDVIAVQKSDVKDRASYRLNHQGYCKLRLSKFVKKGRYLYKDIVNSSYIFKMIN